MLLERLIRNLVNDGKDLPWIRYGLKNLLKLKITLRKTLRQHKIKHPSLNKIGHKMKRDLGRKQNIEILTRYVQLI